MQYQTTGESMNRSVGTVLGIFVGGASRRMGGRPKGLLHAPTGESIVERWRAMAKRAGLPCLLVGNASAYDHLGMESVADARPDSGPLGGLIALLRATPDAQAVAVACDMPFVSLALLARLAFFKTDAAVLAPRHAGRYEPLFARYDSARVLPTAERQSMSGDLSLQSLLRAARAETLELSAADWQLLVDWDKPDDVSS
jgi:molybdopterin-guanine dinucleotide biosynthesis protein A